MQKLVLDRHFLDMACHHRICQEIDQPPKTAL
jgi:hypothetical protein